MKITLQKAKPTQKNIILVRFQERQQGTYVQTLPSGQKEIIISIDEKSSITPRKLILLARKIIATARSYHFSRIAISFDEFVFPQITYSESEIAELLAREFEMANYEFIRYKTPPKEGWNFVNELALYGKESAEIKKALDTGTIIGEAVNATRELTNTPGAEMTPKILAKEAQKASVGTKIKTRILMPTEMRKFKMEGVLGVAKGSVQEPRFIIMEYWGGSKKEKPVVLVGKGVTFDTGGINLKPSDAIADMQMDMSGGAAAIYAIAGAARLGLKKNVVALIPAVENMPSGSSYHPGDVLRTMSGKTIQIDNTDAEGRVIMSDALTYAKKYGPKLVIDIATLTGASLVALGQRASAIFTSEEKLEQTFRQIGETSGDYVWPLPLWEEYEDDIKATYADWSNTGKTRWGGTITAATFLKQWAEGYPWVHIDMAPRMTTIEGEYLAKGAAGAPVRLLISYLRSA